MPIVQISVVAGRDPQALKRCAQAVARTVHDTLGAPLATIRVLVHEVPAALWAVGDQTRDHLDAARAGASLNPESPT